MGVGSERKLVKVVQQALSRGPISQDGLLAMLRQLGLRTDTTGLYLACATHGLADLRGDARVPRGWAAR